MLYNDPAVQLVGVNRRNHWGLMLVLWPESSHGARHTFAWATAPSVSCGVFYFNFFVNISQGINKDVLIFRRN